MCKNYEVPHYVVFSINVHTLSPTLCSEISSISHTKSTRKFHCYESLLSNYEIHKSRCAVFLETFLKL